MANREESVRDPISSDPPSLLDGLAQHARRPSPSPSAALFELTGALLDGAPGDVLRKLIDDIPKDSLPRPWGVALAPELLALSQRDPETAGVLFRAMIQHCP